uniref:Uncharacterized protein n=1 Tax=Sphaerodactylus townsendi TaxID=933632 RepID=A0ACB8FRH8_9SAUR
MVPQKSLSFTLIFLVAVVESGLAQDAETDCCAELKGLPQCRPRMFVVQGKTGNPGASGIPGTPGPPGMKGDIGLPGPPGTSFSSTAPVEAQGTLPGQASNEGLSCDKCLLIIQNLLQRVESQEVAQKRIEATLQQLKKEQERTEEAHKCLRDVCKRRRGP